jgi:hypothetical protein
MTPLINLPYICVFDQAILRVISKTRTADPGCLFIPDLDFYPSRIPDPKTATKERGEKNLLSYLFCSHKFHKIENYFIFEMLKKKIWASFLKELYNFLPKNLSLSSKNYGFKIRDPRSGIRNTAQNYHFLNVYSLAYLFLSSANYTL